MIVTGLSVILFVIFSVIAVLHFYWFFGGLWGLKKVIPTAKSEPDSLAIPKFATLLVALVFVLFGLLYLSKTGLIQIPFPNWATAYGYWIIPSLFALRSIGEFRYVGFFKKIKNTEFAKADSQIFSPLCMGIGIIGVLILFI